MHKHDASTFGDIEKRHQQDGLRCLQTHHGAGTTIPWHSHELATINFVLHGRYCEKFSGTCGEHEQFEVLYKPPGESHSNFFGRSYARCLLIEIGADRFRRLVPQLKWLSETVVGGGPEVRSAGFRLLAVLDDETPSQASQVESALLEFLFAIGGDETSRTGRTLPNWLLNVRSFLDANPFCELSLSEIADMFHVHVTHLAREFKRYYNKTVGEYLRAQRLDAAARMLAGSEMSIVQISTHCRFADQSHFNRWCKRSFGMTAAQFRRRFS